MENKYVELFDEFTEPNKKYMFPSKKGELLVYISYTEKIDLIQELNRINALPKKYLVPEF